ncbi:MAG: DNA mismatch repair protein MutS, partial [Pseudomonadota bacterium]
MAGKVTPMMEQYLALKREAEGSLLFYRMGDFFELFFDDAKVASEILDIALTSRGEHEGEPVAMCGVPVHSAEGYLARLIKAGCRVAIAEQVETPEEAKVRAKKEGWPASKALVKREIVRFVTAGTLTEEALLEPRRANILVALAEVRGVIGIASCDISTGLMVLEHCAPEMLGAELARLDAIEILVPDGWVHGPDEVTHHNQRAFSSDEGEAQLKHIHGVATLDGFGAFSRAMLAAAGGLIGYLDHVGRGALPLLLPPTLRAEKSGMAMDEA